MEYAVIENKGVQFKIVPGQTIELEGESQDKNPLNESKVLLYVNDKDVIVGKPYLENVNVLGKVIASTYGKKVRVSRFTAKSRHRRVIGFRPKILQVQIEKIVINPSSRAASSKKKA
jgi:large subunit ribosomal protein L21